MSGEWAVLWTIAGWIDGGGELRVNHSRIARVLKEKAILAQVGFSFLSNGKKESKGRSWDLESARCLRWKSCSLTAKKGERRAFFSLLLPAVDVDWSTCWLNATRSICLSIVDCWPVCCIP